MIIFDEVDSSKNLKAIMPIKLIILEEGGMYTENNL